MQSTCNVLHTLPDDAVDVVLRHLSRIPRSTNWASHLNPAIISALGGSGVSVVLRKRIHALNAFLASPDDAAALFTALEVLCESCTSLDVFLQFPAALTLPQVSTRNLHQLSLTVGSVSAPVSDLLHSLPSLRALRIDAPPKQAEALYTSVRLHCPKLESLDLHVGFRTTPGLAAMFRSLNNLRSLTLTIRDALIADGTDTEPLAFAPLLQCPLHEIIIHGDLRGTRADFENTVLAMPGLEKLAVRHIGTRPAFPLELVTVSPSIQVETDVMPAVRTLDDYLHAERVNPTRVMDILKHRLTGFAFRCGFHRNQVEFTAAAAHCTALRSLSITDLGNNGTPIIDALFPNPRPNLEELRLAFTCDELTMSSCLRTVAVNSGSLEAIEISGIRVPKADYELLSTCNPALCGVRIVMRIPTSSQKEANVLAALDAFSNHLALRTLTIDTFGSTPWTRATVPHAVRLLCRNYREVHVDVVVDGSSH